MKGWHCDIRGIKNYDELPQETKDYVEFIEILIYQYGEEELFFLTRNLLYISH